MQLQVLLHNEQRVLTTQQLAEIYETDVANIKMNFSRNKARFIEGKHYHILKGADLKAFKDEVTDSYFVGKNASQLILWTEKGADRHCKILDTDKAWEQFDNLEETYFRVKENQQVKLPSTPMEVMKLMFQAMEDTNEKMESLEKRVKEVEVKATMTWKDQMKEKINTVCEKRHILNVKLLGDLYKRVECDANIRLDLRLRNLKERKKNTGASYAECKRLKKIDVIEADGYAKALFEKLLSEY